MRRVPTCDLRGDAVWNVVGGDFDARASVDCGELPGHRHGAGQGGVVGHEVNGLNDPDVLGDLDVSSLDDVRICGGLSRGASSVGVSQDQSVRASGPRIEPLELCTHSFGREPSRQCIAIDEGGVHQLGRGGDHPRCGVCARHPVMLWTTRWQPRHVGRGEVPGCVGVPPDRRETAVGCACAGGVDHGGHGWPIVRTADSAVAGHAGPSWLVRAVPGLIIGFGLIAMAAAMLLAARSGVNDPVSKEVSIGPFDVVLVYSTPTPMLVVAGLVTVVAFVVLVCRSGCVGGEARH